MKDLWKTNILFCFPGDDESAGAEDDDSEVASEEAAGEEDEVRCDCNNIHAVSNVDVFCTSSINFPFIWNNIVKNIYLKNHNGKTYQHTFII
jgi:hypothetical protein